MMQKDSLVLPLSLEFLLSIDVLTRLLSQKTQSGFEKLLYLGYLT